MAIDIAATRGLTLAKFSDATLEKLAAVSPVLASNPVDLGPGLPAYQVPGGVASRTLPAAFFEPVPFAVVAFAERLPDVVRAEAADLRDADVERFLDGPQVDMALPTVPTGCHTRP